MLDQKMGTPSYTQRMDAAIRDVLLEFECQPILFVGSGLSRRYFGAPTWADLLRSIAVMMPQHADKYDYLSQRHRGDLVKVGSELSDLVFEWAWGDGRNHFPKELFSDGVKKDCFIKYLACQMLQHMTPQSLDQFTGYQEELEALSAIRPHAIITTNYDLSLEVVFDGYAPVTGQTIIRYNTNSFGEIFHIHGDVSAPSTIVLTEDDYAEWTTKKKYISAKLLTYFAEHPIFIIGYGMGDQNVKEILRDIGEIVADETGLIPNVYQVFWHEKLPLNISDHTVFAVDGREFRINAIHVEDFTWLFQALKSRSALTSVNPKLVRALAARTMKLVRHDIPSGNVQVNYDILERIADQDTELPKLLGIAVADNPNHTHPLTITQVASRLGFASWNGANKLILKIREQKSVDLRSSDNAYHWKIKTGPKSMARKWSHATVDLLQKVKAGEDYELHL